MRGLPAAATGSDCNFEWPTFFSRSLFLLEPLRLFRNPCRNLLHKESRRIFRPGRRAQTQIAGAGLSLVSLRQSQNLLWSGAGYARERKKVRRL